MAPPRCPLAVTPTPLQPMRRLGRHLGFEPDALWVKRDDLTGLAGGGNKARKLEYLVGDALRARLRHVAHWRRSAEQSRPDDGGGGVYRRA